MKHSVRLKFTAIFIGIVAAIMAATWMANSWGLEKFYTFQKLQNIREAYTQIDQIVTADGESVTNEKLGEILQEYSEKYNISIAVIDSLNNKALITSERDGDYLLEKAQKAIFGSDSDKMEILYENNNIKILINKTDKESAFIECYGYCSDNQTLIIMSTPVSNMRESVAISNRFLAYIGIIAMLGGIVIVTFMTRKITKPILKLASLSERMGRLDFDARYDDTMEDEVGILGQNMNVMADKLEETITELKNANIELQQDIKKKEAIDKMRVDFISNVSHELKTPIALIQGYAEGMEEGMATDESSKEYYISVIKDEATKMNRMVRQLLTLSSLESGNALLDIQRFDLNELIRGIISSTKILLEGKNVEIKYDDSKTIYAWGDEFKIEEVLTNLISNAINHVTDGGNICISTDVIEGNRVRVEVYNDGKFIPEEDIEHLWDKFYKVDKAHSRSYGGTGIGLSIVKAIMDAHNMPYGVYNKDQGVAFWVELDAKDA